MTTLTSPQLPNLGFAHPKRFEIAPGSSDVVYYRIEPAAGDALLGS